MRFILGFIGAVFAGVLLISLIGNLATYFSNPPAPLAVRRVPQGAEGAAPRQ